MEKQIEKCEQCKECDTVLRTSKYEYYCDTCEKSLDDDGSLQVSHFLNDGEHGVKTEIGLTTELSNRTDFRERADVALAAYEEERNVVKMEIKDLIYSIKYERATDDDVEKAMRSMELWQKKKHVLDIQITTLKELLEGG